MAAVDITTASATTSAASDVIAILALNQTTVTATSIPNSSLRLAVVDSTTLTFRQQGITLSNGDIFSLGYNGLVDSTATALYSTVTGSAAAQSFPPTRSVSLPGPVDTTIISTSLTPSSSSSTHRITPVPQGGSTSTSTLSSSGGSSSSSPTAPSTSVFTSTASSNGITSTETLTSIISPSTTASGTVVAPGKTGSSSGTSAASSTAIGITSSPSGASQSASAAASSSTSSSGATHLSAGRAAVVLLGAAVFAGMVFAA